MDLYIQLATLLANKESVKDVLARHSTKDVLNALIKAIHYSNTTLASEVISSIENKADLKKLLESSFTVHDNVIEKLQSLVELIEEKERALDNVPIVEGMKSYNSLKNEEHGNIKCALFYGLISAIEKHEDIKGLLKNDAIKTVLNVWVESPTNNTITHTVLTHATTHANTQAIEDIFNTLDMDDDTLKNLFTAKSRIRGTDEYIALDYAKHLTENTNDSALKQAYEKIANQIRKKMKDSGVLVEEDAGRCELPFHPQETVSAPAMGEGSGNGEVGDMKLFNQLVAAIRSNKGIESILKRNGIQGVLNMTKEIVSTNGAKDTHTVLTYAIDCNNTVAANAILAFNTISDEATEAVLICLLMAELEMKDETGKTEKYTALSYAEKKGHTELAQKIKQKMHDLGISIPGEEKVDTSGRCELPFHPQETASAPAMGEDSGNGIDKNALFDELVNAIKNGDCIDTILQNKAIQAVLNLQKIEYHIKTTIIYDTVLTYAIYHNIEAARSILKAVNHDTLKKLLEAKQTIKDARGESHLSALECAKNKKYHYTRTNKDGRNNLLIKDLESLIKEIEGKMNDLKIPIKDENAVDEAIKFLDLQPLYHQTGNHNQHAEAQGVQQPSARRENNALPHNHGKAGDSGNASGMEDIQDNSRRGNQAKVSDHSGKDGKSHISLNGDNGLKKKNEKFPSSIANDVFFAVLKGDSKHANGLLNQYKEDPALFQSGWMQILLIGDKEARELAQKDNKNIIKEIQKRQGAGICLIGSAALLVSGILTIALLSPIPILIGVSIGLIMCIGGACHKSQEVPDTAMDKTANEKHGKLQPSTALPA